MEDFKRVDSSTSAKSTSTLLGLNTSHSGMNSGGGGVSSSSTNTGVHSKYGNTKGQHRVSRLENFQYAVQQLHGFHLFATAAFVCIHVMLVLTAYTNGGFLTSFQDDAIMVNSVLNEPQKVPVAPPPSSSLTLSSKRTGGSSDKKLHDDPENRQLSQWHVSLASSPSTTATTPTPIHKNRWHRYFNKSDANYVNSHSLTDVCYMELIRVWVSAPRVFILSLVAYTVGGFSVSYAIRGGLCGVHSLVRLVIVLFELIWYGTICSPAHLIANQIFYPAIQGSGPHHQTVIHSMKVHSHDDGRHAEFHTSRFIIENAFLIITVACAFIDLQRVFDGLVGVKPLREQVGYLMHFRSGKQRRAPRRNGRKRMEDHSSESEDAEEGEEDFLRVWRQRVQHQSYGSMADLTNRYSSSANRRKQQEAEERKRKRTINFGCETEFGFWKTYTFSWLNPFMNFGARWPKKVKSSTVPRLPKIHHALDSIYRPLGTLWDEEMNGKANLSAVNYLIRFTLFSVRLSITVGGFIVHVFGKIGDALLQMVSTTYRSRVERAAEEAEKEKVEKFLTVKASDQKHSTVSKDASLLRLFFARSGVGRHFIMIAPLKLGQDIFGLCGPVVVGGLIRFIKSPDGTLEDGLQLLSIFVLVLVLQSLFFQAYLKHLYAVSMDCGTAARCLIFEKAIRLPTATVQSAGYTEGIIMSLATVDAGRVSDTLIVLHNSWGHPLTILVSMLILQFYVGWPAALAALAALTVLIPVNRNIAAKLKEAQATVIHQTSTRVDFINQVLNAIRTIKANAWEHVMLKHILGLRNEEYKSEDTVVAAEALNAFQTEASIASIATVCFATYYATGGALEAERLIPALAALNQLRFPVWTIPGLVSSISKGLISKNRIEKFLSLPENSNMTIDESVAPGTIALVGDAFAFGTSEKPRSGSGSPKSGSPTSRVAPGPLPSSAAAAQPSSPSSRFRRTLSNKSGGAASCASDDALASAVLFDINLSIDPGSFVIVKGKVGSGKSALLYSILGEMEILGGSKSTANLSSRRFDKSGDFSSSNTFSTQSTSNPAMKSSTDQLRKLPIRDFDTSGNRTLLGSRIGGTVAFCGEMHFLRNESIRMNICMDIPHEDEWYDHVVAACALDKDFATFPNGDMTIVGDRGVQLSGGQKARVALARACYTNSDIYLLDGVLSALDVRVGKHIIDHVFHDLLLDKTIILTAHSGFDSLKPDRMFEIKDGRLIEDFTTTPGMRSPVRGSMDAGVDGLTSTQTPPPAGAGLDSPTRRLSSFRQTPSKASMSNLFKDSPRSRSGSASNHSNPGAPKPEDKLVRLSVQQEHRLGKVTTASNLAYKTYLNGFGYGAISVVVLSCFQQAMQTGMDVWLGMWISRRITTGTGFLVIYSLLGVAAASFSFVRARMFFRNCFSSATKLHNNVCTRLLSAPLSYFDTVPHGIASSALSKDQDVVDRQVPESVDLLLSSTLRLVAVCAFNSVLSPVFLLILPFMGVLFRRISLHYLKVSAEVRRMENRSQSNSLSLLKEATQGAVSIRAMRLQEMVQSEYCKSLDVANTALNVNNVLSRWVGLRLEMVSITLVTCAALAAIMFRNDVSPAFAGVAVVNCLNTSRTLLLLCRRIGMFQNQFTSTEQLARLLANVPHESRYGNNVEALNKAEIVPDNEDDMEMEEYPLNGGIVSLDDKNEEFIGCSAPQELSNDSLAWLKSTQPPTPHLGQSPLMTGGTPPSILAGSSPPQFLPSSAMMRGKSDGHSPPHHHQLPPPARPAIQFDRVSARYRGDTPLILHNVSFTIPMGYKVGIVGRTGAGKSTMFNVLLRLVDYVEGAVKIWGRDSASISKHRLRKEIAIIPQDPVLLKGTWRYNLDPEDTYHTRDDSVLWQALARVSLDTKLQNMPGNEGLDTEITEGGANLSIGERQLLCLARTSIRGSRILLMDEVTANVDTETDQLIQTTIAREFASATTLTIAHRLSTIQNSDMVLVIGGGGRVDAKNPGDIDWDTIVVE